MPGEAVAEGGIPLVCQIRTEAEHLLRCGGETVQQQAARPPTAEEGVQRRAE